MGARTYAACFAYTRCMTAEFQTFDFWWPALAACLGTGVLLAALIPFAHRIALVDKPSARKIHTAPVPLVGGLGVFIVFAAVLYLADAPFAKLPVLLTAGLVLVFIGVIDDFRELPTRIRFVAQIAAGLICCYVADLRLLDMGALRFDGELSRLGAWEVPITVFCVVGVINAFNMLDGMDGLAGGSALISTVALATLAAAAGRVGDAQVLCVFAGCLTGFLILNTRVGRRRALVFFGDAGSLLVGFVLAWFVVDLSQGSERAFAPVQALWIVLVPLFDTVRLLIWRPVRGISPFRGDQEHLHHLLRRHGLSHRRTVTTVLLSCGATAVFGVAGPQLGVSEFWMFYLFMGLFAAYALWLGHAWWQRRWLGAALPPDV